MLWAVLLASALGSAPEAYSPAQASITVLDPVDLGYGESLPNVGAALRSGLGMDGEWAVLSSDSVTARMRALRLDASESCRDFQCAFNAGNALQTDFVLFSTVAPLRGLYAYTLNLLHVGSAQVVWSAAGESEQHAYRLHAALEERLHQAMRRLDPPARLDLRKRPGRGLLAVLDMGDGSDFARAAGERARTRAYGTRAFDLVTPEELVELQAALGIQAFASMRKNDLRRLGRKMGVQYLLCARLSQPQGQYQLSLALFDVDRREMLREWSSRPMPEFRKLLAQEDGFFAGLDKSEKVLPSLASSHSRLWTWSKVAATTLTTAAGLGLGYLGYRAWESADSEYRNFLESRSQEEAQAARQRVSEGDDQAVRFGVLCGVSLALGAVVWVF